MAGLDSAFNSVIARSEATKQSIYRLCRTMDCFAALAMTVEAPTVQAPYFFTLLASIFTAGSSILVVNAVPTSNGFSMPR